MLGLHKEFDGYTLGKFQRGHDVEARAINFLTGIEYQRIIDILDGTVPNPGWIKTAKGAILDGEIYMQYEIHYRGGIGYVDLAQRTPTGRVVFHEVKSKTKMAYDKVSASGRSAAGTPEPYPHESLQLAFYCLGDNVDTGFLHYFNADDYRLTSFSINPGDYQEEIDREIDDIQFAFVSKQLPTFATLLDWHKIKTYQRYGDEWNLLTPAEMMIKLQNEYPEAYERLMNNTLPIGDLE
jgi:hypothetical protein